MQFFIGSNDDPPEISLGDFMLDAQDRIQAATMGELIEASDPDLLMKLDPQRYGPALEAVAELRSRDDGSLAPGQEFKRVASFVNVPLFQAMRMQEGLLKGSKKEFYKFLERYPAYRTYDRRGGSRPRVTFVNGEQIV